MAKVLLVEDDNNLREIFQMRLQAEGYTALTATDGEEGLVVAMKEKPELIVADVMMPKLSGFEMIENLRAAPEMKDTKVIMMTALGQAEDQARGEKLGVVKYLVKSQVTLEDFARVVKEVLGPGDPQAAAAAPQNSDSTTNNQGSENNMPEDTTSNPMPADNGTPAANPTPDSGQQSTADEQSAVQGQVDNFAASAPVADTTAGDPPADTGAPDMPPEAPAPTPSEPAVPSDPAAPSEPTAPTGSEGDAPSAPTDPTSNAL